MCRLTYGVSVISRDENSRFHHRRKGHGLLVSEMLAVYGVSAQLNSFADSTVHLYYPVEFLTCSKGR